MTLTSENLSSAASVKG